MTRLGAGIAACATVVLTGCSSSVNARNTRANSTPTPSVTVAPTSNLTGGSAVRATGASGAKTAAFPTAGPVTSGPLGGSYCDPRAANWTTTASGIEVHVHAQGPSDVSVYVLDAARNPVSNGLARIAAGSADAQIRIDVPLAKVARVSLAISGAMQGICAVQKI